MYKHPYQNQSISQTHQDILQKARNYNINIFENKHLAQILLSEEVQQDVDFSDVLDLFEYLVELKKQVQMSE